MKKCSATDFVLAWAWWAGVYFTGLMIALPFLSFVAAVKVAEGIDWLWEKLWTSSDEKTSSLD